MATSSNNNLWETTAVNGINRDHLSGERNVDIAIIGGGFTGCSAALRAAEKGLDVCLLEAKTIGQGGSGKNVGLVNAGLWTPPNDVQNILGAEAGEKLNKALAAGPDLVFDLIDKHEISCEALRNGTLHCAESQKGLKDLKNRYQQQMERNAPVELLDAHDATQLTGASNIFGALLDKRAGTIQPLAYVQGLAHAALKAGVSIYENSPAQSIGRQGEYWRVKTRNGEVAARFLLVAGNAYLNQNGRVEAPQQALPSYIPVHYFQCATKPLPPELREKILPQSNGCWDTATVMSSFRMDQSGRLIIGSIGSLESFGKKIHAEWIKRKALQLFPILKNFDFEYSWHGRIAMTDDHLPRIVDLGEGGLSIYGYNGRGISPGTTFGKNAIDHLLEPAGKHLPLPAISKFSQSLPSIKSNYYEFGASITHLISQR